MSKVARKQKRGQADKPNRGWYARRRGILEHLEAGTITLLDSGIHDWLCMIADYRTGLAIASSEKIIALCGNSVDARTIRRSLARLEALGWIKRWMVKGKKGNYPILIARFEVACSCSEVSVTGVVTCPHFDRDGVRDVSVTAYRVNVERTMDWHDIKYDPVRDMSVTVSALRPSDVRDAGSEVSTVQEVRTKESKKKEKPDADNNSHRTNRGDAASETKSNHQPKIDAVILSWIHGRILESARLSETEITNRRAYLRKGTAEFLKNFDSEVIGYLHEVAGSYIANEIKNGKEHVPYEDIIAHVQKKSNKHHLPINHAMILDAIETAAIEHGFVKRPTPPNEPKPPDQPDQKPN